MHAGVHFAGVFYPFAFLKITLKFTSQNGYVFTLSLSQCYQCCNTPTGNMFFSPTVETQVVLDLPFFLYRTTVQGHYFTDS